MNILPFVLAVLVILSYGFTASFQSRAASRRNQKAHLGLRKTELNFLRQSEKERYKHLPGTPVKIVKKQPKSPSKKQVVVEPKKINPSCSRLNLFPLIDKGREEHPHLYETAAKLLRIFYHLEKGFEYTLLDSLITAAKQSLKEEVNLPIETIDLKDSELQFSYYTMLKGTKKYLLGKKGYPPLIDYFKIERKNTSICLFDANPTMLSVFFGIAAGNTLYEYIHEGQKQTLDLETLIDTAGDSKLSLIHSEVWKLLDFNRPTHGNKLQQTLVSEDPETGISLRKKIQI